MSSLRNLFSSNNQSVPQWRQDRDSMISSCSQLRTTCPSFDAAIRQKEEDLGKADSEKKVKMIQQSFATFVSDIQTKNATAQAQLQRQQKEIEEAKVEAQRREKERQIQEIRNDLFAICRLPTEIKNAVGGIFDELSVSKNSIDGLRRLKAEAKFQNENLSGFPSAVQDLLKDMIAVVIDHECARSEIIHKIETLVSKEQEQSIREEVKAYNLQIKPKQDEFNKKLAVFNAYSELIESLRKVEANIENFNDLFSEEAKNDVFHNQNATQDFKKFYVFLRNKRLSFRDSFTQFVKNGHSNCLAPDAAEKLKKEHGLIDVAIKKYQFAVDIFDIACDTIPSKEIRIPTENGQANGKVVDPWKKDRIIKILNEYQSVSYKSKDREENVNKLIVEIGKENDSDKLLNLIKGASEMALGSDMLANFFSWFFNRNLTGSRYQLALGKAMKEIQPVAANNLSLSA